MWEELKRLQRQLRDKIRRLHLVETEKRAEEIGKLYEDAAEKISAAFLQIAATSDNDPTNDQIVLIITMAGQIFEELARARNQIIDQAINEGAARGVQYVEALEQALKTGTTEGALEQAGIRLIFDHTNLAAAEAIKKKIYPDGLNLSRRLWRLDRRTKQGLNRLLIDGVKNGRAAVAQAKKIAKMDVSTPAFPKYLANLEREARKIARGAGDPGMFSKALAEAKRQAAKRKSGPLGIKGPTNTLIRELSKANAESIDAAIKTWLTKKARYHATVVTRHETNEAFKKAHLDSAEKKDWIIGFRWSLSKSHPRRDICDELATQDLYGLGPGGYPKGKVPETPHPQDMCFLTDIIDPEKLPQQAGAPTQPKPAQSEPQPSPASRPPRQVQLSDQEKKDIEYYTTGAHERINAALRGEEPLTPQIIKTAEAINKALLKLPSYQGVSYRVVDFDDQNKLDAFLNAHRLGKVVSHRAFTSTSLDPNIWGGRKLSTKSRIRVMLKVNGKSGRDIAAYSRYPDEKEILFPMKRVFFVKDIKKNQVGGFDMGFDIELEEVL